MHNLNQRVAVITGAASGIGRSLALELADAGAHVAISDIDQAGLDETEALLEKKGGRVHKALLDVSQKDDVYAYAEDVAQTFGAVHIVINNAGVTVIDTVEELSYEDFEWLMSINFWGVVYGTKAFLPHLKAADEGHIVNISSVFGLIGVPTQSAYNAAKFAVRGFTEALSQELEIEGSTVRATSVHPGGIDTDIVKSARFGAGSDLVAPEEKIRKNFEKSARTTPTEAARVIIKGIKENQKRVLIGNDAVMIDAIQRIFPTNYQAVNQKITKMLRKRR